MKYQVICQGRLLAGAKEKECINRIQEIMKLSEDEVRDALLSGQPRKMYASNNKRRIREYSQALHDAGLDVLIQDVAEKRLQELLVNINSMKAQAKSLLVKPKRNAVLPRSSGIPEQAENVYEENQETNFLYNLVAVGEEKIDSVLHAA
ncbi:hypothetical protein GMJAKD_00470 [Candidatus Electrothrix aarhusensis]